MYIRTEAPATILPPIVKRTMSAMYSAVDNYHFHDNDSTAYIKHVLDVDRAAITHFRDVPDPRPGEFKRDKITEEHHTHYRPEELWKIAETLKTTKLAAKVVLAQLRKIEGVTESVVATFLAFMISARPQVAYMMACSRHLWAATDVCDLADRLKKVSTPMKSMHNYAICDLTELFELQVLVNRGIGEIDWCSEQSHRTAPDVIDVKFEDVYNAATQIFAMGKHHGYKYRTMNADKYVKARWEWVPSGSVHSQHHDDKPYIAESYRHRTKFVALNMMSSEYVKRMITDRPPQIRAWASVKYEWAKRRAIYGVDLTSSVITNFAMFRCEEVFKHRFPVGEEAAAERVHKRLSFMLKTSESFCYDFDDFNAQHSVSSMQAVLVAYHNVFYGDMSDDQRAAMEWVIKSLGDVMVHNNETSPPQHYQTAGTLLSGWRLTTFMNTALNYIYFKIAGCFDIAGVKDSVHNGDDVLVAISDIQAATRIHHQMSLINARAQATKCNVFSVGEFLRVDHKVTRETGLGAQYLTRACATLVHSRVESQEPVVFTDAIKAAIVRADELADRAKVDKKFVTDLKELAYQRLATVFGRTPVEAEIIAKSHMLVGGASKARFAPVDYLIEEKPEYDEYDPRSQDVPVSELLPGMRDYATTLSKQFADFIDFDDVLGRITAATRRQTMVTRKTWLSFTPLDYTTKYKYGRMHYKSYRDIVRIPHLEKARFAGISPLALIDHKSFWLVKGMFFGVSDVYYAMRALL